MTTKAKRVSLLESSIVVPAIGDSFRKLDPRTLVRNPVMFAVEIVAAAATLRKMRSDTVAKVLLQPDKDSTIFEPVRASDLQAGQVVLVEAGDLIPGDGEVIEGVATVNESAITGESAPVIRETGKVLTHRHLLQEVWGGEDSGDVQALRVFIRQLRQKLETDSERPRHILTEPGVGYRLQIQE
jgi:high-affinity K+ transport system ATPase subunit B